MDSTSSPQASSPKDDAEEIARLQALIVQLTAQLEALIAQKLAMSVI